MHRLLIDADRCVSHAKRNNENFNRSILHLPSSTLPNGFVVLDDWFSFADNVLVIIPVVIVVSVIFWPCSAIGKPVVVCLLQNRSTAQQNNYIIIKSAFLIETNRITYKIHLEMHGEDVEPTFAKQRNNSIKCVLFRLCTHRYLCC